MIYIGICDDEEIYRDNIKSIVKKVLQNYEIKFKIYEFISGEDIIKNYPKKLDILILDVKMRDLNGLDVARNIRKYDNLVEIIFMTYVAEFMKDGYEVKAYRYLLKPIEEKEIIKHLKACVDNIIDSENSHLTIINKNYLDRVKIDSILYVETDRPNLKVYTSTNMYTIRISMSKMESILKRRNFYRCHNSYLVNLKLVESMNGNELFLGDKKIPVSKYRNRMLKLALANVIGDIIC